MKSIGGYYTTTLTLTQGYDGDGQSVRWVHSDPVTGSSVETGADGGEVAETRREVDLFGSLVPLTDPSPPDWTPDWLPPGNGGFVGHDGGNTYDPSSGCVVDGFATPCAQAAFYLSFGAGIGRQVTGADLASPHNAGFATTTTYSRVMRRGRYATGKPTEFKQVDGGTYGLIGSGWTTQVVASTAVVPLGAQRSQSAPQSGQQNPYPAPPSNCEDDLAKLFGDPEGKPGARMSITTDISTGGYRGYDPKVPASASPDVQHLFFFPHLTSPDGNAMTPVYVPGDFTYIGQMTLLKVNGPMRMFYSKERNATVFILHLSDFQTTRRGSRTFVGNTGGTGGNDPGNLHAHFAVHKGRGFDPSKRVPFSTVFCKKK